MRDLVVQAFVTLDGVMQAPSGPEEDPTGGFDYGGWSVNAWDEAMMETMGEATQALCEYQLGRTAGSLALVDQKTSSAGVLMLR